MLKYTKFLSTKSSETLLEMKKNKLYRNFIMDKFSFLLPFDLSWNDINGNNFTFIHELFNLLEKNYVEDFYSFLRFNYIHECIRFAISGPKWGMHFNLSLKFIRTKKLIGFISSNFRKIVTSQQILFCSEINFLCLEKKLRKKFFVQVLIREISRRLNCLGIVTAIYTTGLPFLKPLLIKNYFYFLLNSSLENSSKKIKKRNPFLRDFKSSCKLNFLKCIDQKNIHSIIRSNRIKLISKGKKIYKHFNIEDCLYWFRFIKGFKYTFIKQDYISTDCNSLISFYSLPCKTVNNKKPSYFYDSYFYYSIISNDPKSFLEEILDITGKIGFDLFYILEGNFPEEILRELKFQKGQNGINFYTLGSKLEKIEPLKSGLIFF
jgi:glycylpeptide N-tetradecanoyltransferase